MVVKDKFELIYKTDGNVLNIVPLSRGTLKAYEIDKNDFRHLQILADTFGRLKGHPANKIVSENSKNLIVVDLPTYPLPAFVTKSGQAVVNINVLPAKLLTDYSVSDIFSMFLYALSLQVFISKKPFKLGTEADIAGMIFSIFMKIFGKKSGLIGSYKYLIPKLQFLIYLYVSVSMLGIPDNESTRKRISSIVFVDIADMKLDYNFGSTKDFLKSINDNELIPLSQIKFSTSIVSIGGVSSLPMFEDISRFFATILASTVPNSQFSHFWTKVNQNLFNKLVEIGLRNLSRGV
jgi:hypothetical protein